jgi:hypothetical protein
MDPMVALRLALDMFLVAGLLGPAHAGGDKIAIELLKPKDGTTFAYGDSPPRIVLRWTGSGPVQHYVLQIAKEQEVATYEIRDQTTFTFRPKQCGTYRWWVAGVGPGDRTTQPGDIRTFVVVLGAPAPNEPPEGKVFPFRPERSAVHMSWSNRPVSRYRLELAWDQGFSRKLVSRTATKTTASARIESPGTVYWRVQGVDPDTAWSRICSFKLAMPVPEPISPEDNTAVEFSGPTVSMELSWKPVPAADSYFVDVRKNGSGKKKHPYQTRDTKVEAQDLQAGRYTWKVRAALDSGPESEPSPKRTFQLIAAKPLAPEPPGSPRHPAPPKLLAPEDQARISTPTPQPVILFWQLLDGAQKYQVELARKGDFSRVEVRRSVEGPMVSIPDLFQGTWYWRVRAVGKDGVPGDWADPWVFTHRIRRNWGDWQ